MWINNLEKDLEGGVGILVLRPFWREGVGEVERRVGDKKGEIFSNFLIRGFGNGV